MQDAVRHQTREALLGWVQRDYQLAQLELVDVRLAGDDLVLVTGAGDEISIGTPAETCTFGDVRDSIREATDGRVVIPPPDGDWRPIVGALRRGPLLAPNDDGGS